MVFLETSVFAKQIGTLLTDDEYRRLQSRLMAQPDLGTIIQGSGGIRKVRWGQRGRGKSGGIRAIYFWAVSNEKILMLYAYSKNEKDDLTKAQIRFLKQIVGQENYG